MNVLSGSSKGACCVALLLACGACSRIPFFGGQRAPDPSAPIVAPVEKPSEVYARARAELDALQADASLASFAPEEIGDAEDALKQAQAGDSGALGDQRVYVADRRVKIAITRAKARQLAKEVETLRAQRDAARSALPR